MITFVYELATVTILSLASVLSVASLSSFSGSGAALVFATILCAVAFVVLRNLKTKLRLAFLGIIIAVIAGLFLSSGKETRTAWLLTHKWVFLVLLISLLCFLLEEIARHRKAVKLLPSVAGLLVLFLSLRLHLTLGKGAVLMILAFLVLTLLELLELRWKKEGDTASEAHIVYLLPVMAVLFVILSLSKAPSTPYGWDFVKSIAENVKIRYALLLDSLNFGNGFDDGAAEVGFSDHPGFFPSLKPSSYQVLTVKSNLPKQTVVYLGGRSFDTFDGRQWEKEDDSDLDYRTYDLLESTAAVATHDPDRFRDYLRSASLEITCTGLRTNHVFSPSKGTGNVRGEDTIESGGDLLFTKGRPTHYRVDYYRLNRDYQGFATLAEAPALPTENSLSEALSALPLPEDFNCTTEDLAQYRQRIHQLYGEKPALSPEMEALLAETLSGTDSDYEKLLRIEAMFSDMSYTKTPGELPKTVASPEAFLDYFMLDRREGYCTHFATAFVLLARAEGIPARYVQGYRFTAGSGETVVLSDQSHAWAEAYLDGLGWVSFEPTPGFQKAMGWTVDEDTNRQDEGNSTYGDVGKPSDTADDTALPDTEESATGRESITKRLRLPVTLAIVFLIVFVLLDLAVRRYRYKQMTDREKLSWLFAKAMRRLKHLGFIPAPGETLSEFSKRVSDAMPEEDLAFLNVYEDILYGEREALPSDVELFTSVVKRGLPYRWRIPRH